MMMMMVVREYMLNVEQLQMHIIINIKETACARLLRRRRRRRRILLHYFFFVELVILSLTLRCVYGRGSKKNLKIIQARI